MSAALPPPEACYVGASDRPLFAWLHRSAETAGSLVAVLCNPFGYESICGHRSYRVLAEEIARAGVPALRFDYAGTGDSAPGEPAPSIQGWVASTREAIDAAKRLTGATSVVLVGVRIGAMVAALTAAEREDAAGLVAIAPILTGRTYVRELRALQMALGLAAAPPSAEPLPEGGQEAVGFYLSPEGKTALSEVDLVKGGAKPAPRVLVIDRDDFPPSDKYLDRLRALGVAPDHERLPGYPEMMLDPHKVVVPKAIIAAASAWIARLPSATSGERAPVGAPEKRATMSDEVVERTAPIGPVFGIVSAPRDRARRNGRSVVMLNAGSIHRVGPNELYTRLARELAARGFVCLRLDLSGIGDSPPRPGEPANDSYSPRATEDLEAALAWLAREEQAGSPRVLGLCSGAYHGFTAASNGVKLRRAILINPLTFFWSTGMPLDIPAHKITAEAKRYSTSMFQVESWKKLLRGDVKVRVVAEILGKRAAGIVRERGREVLRRLEVPLERDVASALVKAKKQGTEIAFVFAKSDPGHDILVGEAGGTLTRLEREGAVSVDVVDGPDHTFTPVWSHAPLLRLLTNLTERPDG
ncbi:MAG: alpha/beta fold hydrolase [Polyangiaceae bacterium]